ncbi:uncharacterized protein PFL1_05272 [Pseudozyma flocculosa PF-1]|uniref:Related to Isonitrile hydratase n=2 Tax=Pseudozyma flocculosa TaxID=84751 RepID=A0A5C3F8Q1_9BASI|nr:uncharacterized protein PFL1_05272 [Pseudozyma flocculosa PF-1]EPQ27351.1 hypothetical protein PFL1_05272 [Pseudozyma flocculosa PF-1]SPO39729.1 related to Isonitrile hydratase [Pseudozyma flocculosa]
MSSTDSSTAPAASPDAVLSVGVALFDGVTQQDYIGPISALGPHCKVHLLHTSSEAVRSDLRFGILPSSTFADVQRVDILLVPGAPTHYIIAALQDDGLMEAIARLGRGARYVTSVCTGAVLLGCAGLLDGYRATTHWTALPVLEAMGIETVRQRVVHDRNRLTGGGVTAGLDFGLTLLAVLKGEACAKATQLILEYDPQPPFNAGSPQGAGKEITALALTPERQRTVQQCIDLIQQRRRGGRPE